MKKTKIKLDNIERRSYTIYSAPVCVTITD